jgi:hypothetical protein
MRWVVGTSQAARSKAHKVNGRRVRPRDRRSRRTPRAAAAVPERDPTCTTRSQSVRARRRRRC